MSFFDSLFGNKKANPAEAAMPYLNQIPGQTSGYFQPYINAGQGALPYLQNEYSQLLGNPGNKLNTIGQSYQQSPGFQFALEQALQGAGHAAAAGGMAGSPAHEQQSMQLGTNLVNQDYNNWLSHAMNLYGAGLQGQQGLASGGLQAGSSLADMIAQTLAQQANMAFRGKQEENSMNNSFLNGIGKLGGAALGGFAGGPWGAFAGYNAMR